MHAQTLNGIYLNNFSPVWNGYQCRHYGDRERGNCVLLLVAAADTGNECGSNVDQTHQQLGCARLHVALLVLVFKIHVEHFAIGHWSVYARV